ncbi:MAG: PmeII family type II restriction endonuclease [Candidatus Desantisbacteria bacterium]
MKQLNLKDIYEYVENHISIFHQKRLEYVQNDIDLNKILKQKNPYLFRAKNILTAQDLVKGFIDAFLLSQEETLFGRYKLWNKHF